MTCGWAGRHQGPALDGRRGRAPQQALQGPSQPPSGPCRGPVDPAGANGCRLAGPAGAPSARRSRRLAGPAGAPSTLAGTDGRWRTEPCRGRVEAGPGVSCNLRVVACIGTPDGGLRARAAGRGPACRPPLVHCAMPALPEGTATGAGQRGNGTAEINARRSGGRAGATRSQRLCALSYSRPARPSSAAPAMSQTIWPGPVQCASRLSSPILFPRRRDRPVSGGRDGRVLLDKGAFAPEFLGKDDSQGQSLRRCAVPRFICGASCCRPPCFMTTGCLACTR